MRNQQKLTSLQLGSTDILTYLKHNLEQHSLLSNLPRVCLAVGFMLCYSVNYKPDKGVSAIAFPVCWCKGIAMNNSDYRKDYNVSVIHTIPSAMFPECNILLTMHCYHERRLVCFPEYYAGLAILAVYSEVQRSRLVHWLALSSSNICTTSIHFEDHFDFVQFTAWWIATTNT